MKIYIDINHPAHVHYFRNFIKKMEVKGNSFIVTNRDDELINYLLDYYEISHFTRNARSVKGKSKFKSLIYLVKIIFFVLKTAIKYKPDAFIGVSAPCAIVGFLLRKPSIILDDTEHNSINHLLFKPFASLILTPYYYTKHLRRDQVYFKAFMEQLYITVIEFVENSSNIEDYVFCRFSSFDASHDTKVMVPEMEKIRRDIVEEVAKNYKVIISCESKELQKEYSDYLFSFKPEEAHEIIRNARLLISDGATMACEAGLLGTPYIYTNPLEVGYIKEQLAIYPWVHKMDYKKLLKELRNNSSFIKDIKCGIKKTDNSFINPTDLLIWIFKDLNRNINMVKGKLIDQKVFTELKSVSS